MFVDRVREQCCLIKADVRTRITLVAWLLHVHNCKMSRQIARVSHPSWTQGALKGLLASVTAHVRLEG